VGVSQGRCIGILATLDTKLEEASYLKSEIERLGLRTCLVDLSLRASTAEADISRNAIADVGGIPIAELENYSRDKSMPIVAGAVGGILSLMGS
jgi:uncharacterized protein (UPF0261 family)